MSNGSYKKGAAFSKSAKEGSHEFQHFYGKQLMEVEIADSLGRIVRVRN